MVVFIKKGKNSSNGVSNRIVCLLVLGKKYHIGFFIEIWTEDNWIKSKGFQE